MGSRLRYWRYVQRPAFGCSLIAWAAFGVINLLRAQWPIGGLLALTFWLVQGGLMILLFREVKARAIKMAAWEEINGGPWERLQAWYRVQRFQEYRALAWPDLIQKLRSERR